MHLSIPVSSMVPAGKSCSSILTWWMKRTCQCYSELSLKIWTYLPNNQQQQPYTLERGWGGMSVDDQWTKAISLGQMMKKSKVNCMTFLGSWSSSQQYRTGSWVSCIWFTAFPSTMDAEKKAALTSPWTKCSTSSLETRHLMFYPLIPLYSNTDHHCKTSHSGWDPNSCNC